MDRQLRRTEAELVTTKQQLAAAQEEVCIYFYTEGIIFISHDIIMVPFQNFSFGIKLTFYISIYILHIHNINLFLWFGIL